MARNVTTQSAHATSRWEHVSQSMSMLRTLRRTTDIEPRAAAGTAVGTGGAWTRSAGATRRGGAAATLSVPGPSVRDVLENLLAPPPGARLDLRPESAGAPAVQLRLDELGTSLAETTFVVVDLETTGGSARTDAITEIGAVKVRGGDVLGEFQTLVDPGAPVPPLITVLTGITDAMLVGAPRIEAVLPAFLEFARGAVLVAHNARFDVGFLREAAARMDLGWPRPTVVDTVQLARRVVTRDEAPNHKLSSLATLFRASVTPNHRALEDARATVDVLHGLLGRLAPLGVTHLEDLVTAADPVPHARRRKAHLADGLPSGPGVYMFLGPRDEILYVGTAVDVRRRVRSYFTATEKRARIGEMLQLAERVRPVPCPSVLEAQVRELRLIAAHKPAYNRRSRQPEREPWLRLTDEPFPRLSLTRTVPAQGVSAIGPFSSRVAAQAAAAALEAVLPVRRCTPRLPREPRVGAIACALAEMGRCGAPCTGAQDGAAYAGVVARVRRALEGDLDDVVTAAESRIRRLAGQERFEEAASHRDQLDALVRGVARAQRLLPLTQIPELVAARRDDAGGWEIVLARHGRLAGTARAPRGVDPRPLVDALRETGETVPAPTVLCGAATAQETELLAAWLERPGTRLVELEGATGWAGAATGAARFVREPGASWGAGTP